MKRDMEDILLDLIDGDIDIDKAKEELLNLHSVSHQMELLESFIEWRNKRVLYHAITYKSDAEDFLEELNESNCG